MNTVLKSFRIRQFINFKSKWQRFYGTNAVYEDNKYVLKSFLPDIVIPKMRFVDRIWQDLYKFGNHVALECAVTKKSYTYRQLHDISAAYATSLVKKLGLKPGDVVAVMLPNCPEFAVIAVGTLQAGCVMTPLNPMYKELEVSHQISTTEAKVVITIPQCYETVSKSLQKSKSNAKIVLLSNPNAPLPDGTIRLSDIAENVKADYSILDKIERTLDDVAVIAFSSGTTGLPKGVELSNKNLFAAIESMYNERTCFPKLVHGKFQDIIPSFLPFFHIFGLVITLFGHLTKGCKFVTMPAFSPGLLFDVMKLNDVSLFYLVPPVALLLAKHPELKEEYLRNVRHFICGAAPLAAGDIEALLRRSKRQIEFNQGYGATETTGLLASTLIEYTEIDYNASGVPMASVSLKFTDPINGNAVPIGEQGEIYAKGPLIMKGYHKNEKATAECITEDGFYKTGDLGHYKPGVGLFVTDRIKELIKVKGFQVAPAELESILRSHPSIQDAAVIGIPHQFHGEVPKAFVTCKNGAKTTKEEIKDFVASKVAEFKKIEDVEIIESIPKSVTGKILRKELRKMC